MLTILFVEDEADAIEDILELIQEEEQEFKCCITVFSEFESNIKTIRPEIVVLDLWEGNPLENNNKGLEKLNFIWKKQFCPVVVHSANPEISEEFNNPFVREITKGQNSPQEVLDAIRELLPHVQALKGAEEHIRDSFSIAVREVAPAAFRFFENIEERKDAILRASRRRLAALMDEISTEDQKLANWEQYICPPISKDVLLGDILRTTDGRGTDPSSFRVVLSPSCDLVSSGGRKPKVSNVLVAKCCSTERGFQLISRKDLGTEKRRDHLKKDVLSRGFFEFIVPFPALEGRIPTMMVNLRELELIPLCEVRSEGKKFCRIASLDSPFRELVSWAYIQVSGRPGLPDRDFERWSKEIVADYKKFIDQQESSVNP